MTSPNALDPMAPGAPSEAAARLVHTTLLLFGMPPDPGETVIIASASTFSIWNRKDLIGKFRALGDLEISKDLEAPLPPGACRAILHWGVDDYRTIIILPITSKGGVS